MLLGEDEGTTTKQQTKALSPLVYKQKATKIENKNVPQLSNGQSVIQAYNGILLSNKKEQSIDLAR